MLVFEERGKPEYPEKNLWVQNQQTQPTCDAESGNQPGPHWWEVSALTTAPSLHPVHPRSSLQYFCLQLLLQSSVLPRSNHWRVHVHVSFPLLAIIGGAGARAIKY